MSEHNGIRQTINETTHGHNQLPTNCATRSIQRLHWARPVGLCGAVCWLGGRVGFCYLVGSEPPCCTRCVSVCHTFALGPSHGMRSVWMTCAWSPKNFRKKKSYLRRKNLSAVDFSLCHLIRCQSKLAFIRCLSNFALVLLELAFGFLEWCSNQYMAFRGLALA